MKLPSFSTIVGIILLLAGVTAGVSFYFAKKFGNIGAGFAAKQLCSCIYVQNREESACLADIQNTLGKSYKDLKLVYFDEKVVANLGGFGQAQAKLEPGFGCSVSDFQGALPNGLENPQ